MISKNLLTKFLKCYKLVGIMGKGAGVRQLVFAAIFFAAPKVAFSQTERHPVTTPSTVRDLQVSDVVVPADLGYVLETHEPTQPSSTTTLAPLIIHIQEAHTNYEAQRHMIGILERLIQDQGLKLILVEGGSGDVGLSYLRAYGPPENRREVADKYLKTGIISAEEYVDIVSDHPLILWGVEDRALYQQNLDAFLSAETLRQSIGPVLASIQDTVELLKPLLLDPAFTALEQDAQAFDADRLSLADYAEHLNRLMARHAVDGSDYPNLIRFLAVREMEQSIRPDAIAQEQRALFAQLGEVVPEATLDQLIDQATQVKAGTVSRDAFYRSLRQLADSSHVSLEAYPKLSGYFRYLEAKTDLNAAELSTELTRLVHALKSVLAATPDGQALSQVNEQVELVDKLLGFRLSPDEYHRFETVRHEHMLSQWGELLNRQLVAHGLPARVFPRLDEFDVRLASLRRFYEAAQQRDAALVEHTVGKLAETREPLAVLITGGFHSPAITQALSARGMRVVVVAPKVSQETNEQLYEAVLKYKAGYGSLAEVQAAAGEVVPAARQ